MQSTKMLTFLLTGILSYVWSHAEVELKDRQLDTTGDNRKKDIQEP